MCSYVEICISKFSKVEHPPHFFHGIAHSIIKCYCPNFQQICSQFFHQTHQGPIFDVSVKLENLQRRASIAETFINLMLALQCGRSFFWARMIFLFCKYFMILNSHNLLLNQCWVLQMTILDKLPIDYMFLFASYTHWLLYLGERWCILIIIVYLCNYGSSSAG